MNLIDLSTIVASEEAVQLRNYLVNSGDFDVKKVLFYKVIEGDITVKIRIATACKSFNFASVIVCYRPSAFRYKIKLLTCFGNPAEEEEKKKESDFLISRSEVKNYLENLVDEADPKYSNLEQYVLGEEVKESEYFLKSF
jgi:hypothetical protein